MDSTNFVVGVGGFNRLVSKSRFFGSGFFVGSFADAPPALFIAMPPEPEATAALEFDFDYLIVGGGAAGLSLAYHLAQEPRLAAKKVLILEPEAKDRNDRTWSFWTNEPTPFDGIVAGEWQHIAFRSPGFEQVMDLGAYRYKTINGLDYYRFVRRALADNPRFTWVQAPVSHLTNLRRAGVRATTPAGEFTAQYAFDSRPPDLATHRQPQRYRYLLQHFVGWEVETDEDVFDPAVVEFMDFRGAQHREARFIYVLPFSPRKALVEYTLFSARPLPKPEYEAAIRE